MIVIYILAAAFFYAAVCTFYNTYSGSELSFPKKIWESDKRTMLLSAVGGILSSVSLYISRADISMKTQVLYWAVMVILAVIALNDIEKKLIPNKLVLAILKIWIIYAALLMLTELENGIEMLIMSFSGFLYALVVFGIGYLIMKNKLGGGDVKLMIILGLVFTGRGVFGVIIYSLIFSMIFALGGIIIGKMKIKDTMPFAPFIFLGTVTAVILY